MGILVTTGDSAHLTPLGSYPSESALEDLLKQNPALLESGDGLQVRFVAQQVSLPQAGILDLLFVNEDGLPIAVEVKLAKNAEARREIVAQSIDYLSALTDLTVDELDQLVNGSLEAALREFSSDEQAGKSFDRRWLAVGTNLRAGLARMVVALDDSPAALQRIFGFLARSSSMDVQLLTVERFTSPVGDVFVPRFVVVGGDGRGVKAPAGQSQPKPQLLQAADAYNAIALPDLKAVGVASYYRQVRPPAWPTSFRTHYELMTTKYQIRVDLHIESDAARPVKDTLLPLVGTVLVEHTPPVVWEPNWSNGKGRLSVPLPLDESSDKVAAVLKAMIDKTHDLVASRLKDLVPPATP